MRPSERRHAPSGSGVLWIAVLALLLGGLVQWVSPAVADGRPLLDTRTGWTAQEARALLAGMGASGRASYGWLLVLDAASGVAFGLAAAAAFSWSARRGPFRRVLMTGVALGLAVALMDVVENLLLASLLASWPDYATGIGAVASGVTTAKLVLVRAVLVALALTAVGCVAWSLRRGRASVPDDGNGRDTAATRDVGSAVEMGGPAAS